MRVDIAGLLRLASPDLSLNSPRRKGKRFFWKQQAPSVLCDAAVDGNLHARFSI